MIAAGTLALTAGGVLAQQRGEGPLIEPRTTPATMPDASGLLATTLPADFEVPVQKLPPEGSILPPTTGDLVALPTGDIAFRPKLPASKDGTSAVPTLPVFALLPSPRLIQIRSVMQQAKDAAREKGFVETNRDVEAMPRVHGTLSGQVWIYRGRAFLSPASFAPAAEEAKAPAQASPRDVKDAAQAASPKDDREGDKKDTAKAAIDQPATVNPTGDDLQKMFEAMEGMASAPRVLSGGGDIRREQSGAATLQNAASAPLLSDGTVLVRRTARFVRMNEMGGRLGLAFDNDVKTENTSQSTQGQSARGQNPRGKEPSANAAGDSGTPASTSKHESTPHSTAAEKSVQLATMALLPCQTLERMEALAAEHADALSFVVTGRVVSDGDRNYFMPLFFQARMPTSIGPGQ